VGCPPRIPLWAGVAAGSAAAAVVVAAGGAVSSSSSISRGSRRVTRLLGAWGAGPVGQALATSAGKGWPVHQQQRVVVGLDLWGYVKGRGPEACRPSHPGALLVLLWVVDCIGRGAARRRGCMIQMLKVAGRCDAVVPVPPSFCGAQSEQQRVGRWLCGIVGSQGIQQQGNSQQIACLMGICRCPGRLGMARG
jgi:hypothetical protein